jgi:hypothetical protein
MRKLNLVEGDIVNSHNIVFVKEIDCHLDSSGRKRRKALFKCHCGELFKSIIADVFKKRTSCGCNKGNKPRIYNEGDLINGIKFIKTLGTVKYAQKAIFECPICNKHWESLIGNIKEGHTKSCCVVKRGWSRSQWTSLSDKAFLYKVKMYNDNESFIKIGITKNSIKKRFGGIPYKYEVIKMINRDSGYIYDLENRIKRLFKKHKYIPLINFKGETECFKH